MLTNEFWLVSYSCGCWIETGWIVQSGDQRPTIFWVQATGAAETSTATLGRAHMLKVIEPADGNSGRFSVIYEGNNSFRIRIATDIYNFETTTVTPMWSAVGHGYVELGSELGGTEGAFSSIVSYEENRAFSRPHRANCLGVAGTRCYG